MSSLLPLNEGWEIKYVTNPLWQDFPMCTSWWQQSELTVVPLKTPLNTSSPQLFIILASQSCKNLFIGGDAPVIIAIVPHGDINTTANTARIPKEKTDNIEEECVWNLAMVTLRILLYVWLGKSSNLLLHYEIVWWSRSISEEMSIYNLTKGEVINNLI